MQSDTDDRFGFRAWWPRYNAHMGGWKWVLVIASWLSALLVSAGGLLLASMFPGSERTAGLIIGAVAVLWLGIPGGGTYLLLRTARARWGVALLALGVVGGGLVVVLAELISAAAQ